MKVVMMGEMEIFDDGVFLVVRDSPCRQIPRAVLPVSFLYGLERAVFPVDL